MTKDPVLDELDLIASEKKQQAEENDPVLQELDAIAQGNEALDSDVLRELDAGRDETEIKLQSAIDGYNTFQATPNKIKDIASATRSGDENLVRKSLETKDADSLHIEADKGNLIRRNKKLANFAGTSKENLNVLKKNYVKSQQLAQKAKGIADGSAFENWKRAADRNVDNINDIVNAVSFFLGTRSLENFVAEANRINKSKQENIFTGEAHRKYEAYWKDADTGFTDFVKMIWDDPETAVIELQKATGAVSSVGASIIGGGAGGLAGAAIGGPVGAVAGTLTGATVNGLAEFGGYISEELENYKNEKGEVDINLIRKDKGFTTRLRNEAAAKGISTAVVEAVLGKIASGVGGKVGAKIFKPKPLAEITKVRVAAKAAATVVAKSAGEAFEEGGGSIITNTGMDAYKGRLTPKKFRENITQGTQDALSGAILGGGMHVGAKAAAPVISSVRQGVSSLLSNKARGEQAFNESSKADTAKNFTEEIYNFQNGLEEMGLSEDKLEEMLQHTLERDATPVQSDSIEVLNASEGGQPMIQLDFLEVVAALGEDKAQEFMSTLPYDIQEQASKNINDGGVTEIPANVFIARTMKYPAVVPLGVHPDAGMHAYDAEELHTKLEAEIEAQLAPRMEAARAKKDESVLNVDLTPVEGVKIKISGQNTIEIDMGDKGLHTINLTAEESAQEYAEVSDTLISGILKKFPDIIANYPDFIPNMAGIATRVVIKRAKVLGLSAKDLATGLTVKYDDPTAYIGYSSTSSKKLPPHIKNQTYNIGSRNRLLTVFHEMGHYILNGMAEDKKFLESQTNITPEQADYLEVIKAAETFLGVDDIGRAIQWPSTPVTAKHPNPEYSNRALMDKNGMVIKNQSREQLTQRTMVHEKFTTSLEKFILKGELPAEATEEFVKIFMYAKDTAGDVTHLLTPELSNVAVEYTNAVDPDSHVGKVFADVFNISEDFLTRVVPLFNFPALPTQLLGAKGPEIIQRVSSVKYNLIAKEFIKFYENQTKTRNKVMQTIKDFMSDAALEEIIANSETPIFSQLVDQIMLGISGKVRLSDLGVKPTTEMDKRIIGMIAETRADTRAIDVAEAFGMEVPDLQIALLNELKKISNNVGEVAYQKALELDPTIKTDKQLQEEFEKGISKALPSLLKKQMQDISKMYPTEMTKFFGLMSKTSPQLRGSYGKLLKAKALENVLNMNARHLTFPRLMGRVRTANAAVINAFSSGRLEHALMAKEEEVVAAYSLAQGLKLKKSVEKAIKDVREFTKARDINTESGVAPEVTDFVKGVIYKIATGQDLTAFNPMTQEMFDKLVSETSKDTGVPSEIITAQLQPLVTIVSKATYSSISKADIDMINDTAAAVRDTVAAKGASSVAATLMLGEFVNRGQNFAERVRAGELSITQGEVAKDTNATIGALLNTKKVIDFRSRYPFKFHDIHTVFRTMYKTDEEYLASPIYKVIEKIINGEAKLIAHKARISEKLHEAFKESFKSDEAFLRTLLGKYSDFAKKDSPYSKPIKSQTLNFTYQNKGELLTAMLLAGSDSGRQKFLLSNGLIDVNSTSGVRGNETAMFNDFDQMYADGIITDADIDAVNKVWEVMAELHPLLKEVHREQRGIFVGKIQASKYSIGGKELTGGYYPVGQKPSTKLSDNALGSKPKTFMDSFFDLYRMQSNWMTKTRSDTVLQEPVDLSLNKISSYIDVALKTYYMERELVHFEAIMDNPDIENLMNEKRIGALMPSATDGLGRTIQNGLINSWMTRTRNQTVISSSDASSVQRFVANNLPVVQYSVAVASAAVNLSSGLAPLISEINPVRVAVEALRTVSTWGMHGVDPSAKSDYMRSREAQFIKFFIDSENSIEQIYTSYEEMQSKFVRPFGLYLMKKSQQLVELTAWRASYSEALSKGKSEAEAVREADFKTRAVVGGYEASASSKGQSGGYYIKLVNMASMHMYSGRRQIFIAYNREGARVTRKIAAFSTALAIVGMGGALDIAMRSALKASRSIVSPEGEDEDEKEAAMLSNTLGYFTGPYGRVLDFAFSPSTSPSPNPMYSALNAVRNTAVAGYEGHLFAPYPLTTKEKKGLYTGASILTGVPFTAVTQLQNIYDLLTKEPAELYTEDILINAARSPYLQMDKADKWEDSSPLY